MPDDDTRENDPHLKEKRERMSAAFLLAHERLLRLAWKILRDVPAAEDACQQAFLKLWANPPDVGPEKLEGWMIRVVANQAIDDYRCHERNVIPPAPETSGRSPLAGMIVAEGLARLDEVTRAVVLMRMAEGWSGNETALRLGLSAVDVSRRLHSGLEQMRTHMHGDEMEVKR